MLKKIIIGLIALVLVAVGIGVAFGGTANASEGDQPCTPSDAYDEVIHHDAVTHVVHHDAVTHVVHHDAVTHSEYHFRKFTHTKTLAPNTPGFWQNFSPTNKHAPFDGPPAYPTDARGKWSAKKTSGGPQQDTSGVFQNGSGNGSWFYRQLSVTSEWSDYGPWTPWEPMTHESWQLNTDPLGSPEFHGQGTYSDGTKWYREWQAQYDGTSRVIVDEDGYDETIVDSEAYDETVVDSEAYDETIHHDAVTCPPNPGDKPEPITASTGSEGYGCGNDYSVVTLETVTIDWVLSDDGSTWVQGEPVYTSETHHKPHRVVPCPTNNPPHHNPPAPQPAPPVKHTVAVPTVIAAGL